MALSKNQVSSRWVRGLRAGLAAATLLANVFVNTMGVQANTAVVSAVAEAAEARPAKNAPTQTETQSKSATVDQVFLDPVTCLQSNWAPFSNTTYIVPQGTISTQVVVSVTSLVAIDATTAQFTAYTPGGGNSPWTATTYTQLSDFTVIMTASNVLVAPPTSGALSSVQFKVSRRNKGVNDADACSPVHTIFAATRKFYLPLIFRVGGDNQRDITTIEEPNNTTCGAYSIAANVKYTARLNDKDDFFRINVQVTSTLIVTVTGFTSSGQVQVRKFTGACDTGVTYTSNSFQGDPVATRQVIVANVVPGDVFIRIASIADLGPNTDYGIIVSLVGGSAATGPYEPNNNACQAYPIKAGTTYQAYPEDTSDWYSFTLTGDAGVVLNLSSFNVSVGQYILYKSSNCAVVPGTLTAITVQDKAATTKDVGTQSAGTYFLRVAVASGIQSSSLYSLRVDVGTTTPPTGIWKPQGETCGVNGCGRSASAGENIKAFWTGMPGLTSLKLKITTSTAGGCPTGNVSSFTPTGYGNTFGNLPLVENGSIIFSNVPKGWYVFEFEGIAPGKTTYSDQRGLKVDCEILFAGQNEPEFSFTDGVTQTQSVTIDLMPEPTAIPEATPIP